MPEFQEASFGKIVFNNKEWNEDLEIRTNGKAKERGYRPENHLIETKETNRHIDDNTELLIVGTGQYGKLEVSEDSKKLLEGKEINLLTAKSPKAIQLYNDQEDKSVVTAVIHSTC